MANEKLAQIKTLFAEKLGMKTVDESKALRDLGLDSLDLAELAYELEDQFGVIIDSKALNELKTVADLYAAIEAKLA